MKRLVFVLILSLPIFATTFNTPQIDGNIGSDWDLDEFLEEERIDGVNYDLYFTWDSLNLYLGIYRGGCFAKSRFIGQNPTDMAVFVAMDVNPGVYDDGGKSGPMGVAVFQNDFFLPDFVYMFNGEGGGFRRYTWTGSTWFSEWDTTGVYYGDCFGPYDDEMTMQWSFFGDPDSFVVYVWVTTGDLLYIIGAFPTANPIGGSGTEFPYFYYFENRAEGVRPFRSVYLKINEIYYDSPGSPDQGCYTELRGYPNMNLFGYKLEGIDGSTGSIYALIGIPDGTLDTTGYYVVAQDNTVPNYDLLDNLVDWENGPDNVLLLNKMNLVLDAVGYGPTDTSTWFFEGEGTPASVVTEGNVLARVPDGVDTDNNQDDFYELTSQTPGAANGPIYVRGDVNIDTAVNVTDAVYLLAHLFPTPNFYCMRSADTNLDGSVNTLDVSYFLSHLFPSPSLPPPNSCGFNQEDLLPCDSYPPCGWEAR